MRGPHGRCRVWLIGCSGGDWRVPIENFVGEEGSDVGFASGFLDRGCLKCLGLSKWGVVVRRAARCFVVVQVWGRQVVAIRMASFGNNMAPARRLVFGWPRPVSPGARSSIPSGIGFIGLKRQVFDISESPITPCVLVPSSRRRGHPVRTPAVGRERPTEESDTGAGTPAPRSVTPWILHPGVCRLSGRIESGIVIT